MSRRNEMENQCKKDTFIGANWLYHIVTEYINNNKGITYVEKDVGCEDFDPDKKWEMRIWRM